MRFCKLNGKYVTKSVTKYKIDWDKKTRSKYQDKVKQFLREYWDGLSIYEEFPVVGTKMTLDFLNLSNRIAVEVQGEQHMEHNKFFHGKTKIKFWDQLDRDVQKKEWCRLNDIELIEVFPSDIPLSFNKAEELGLI